MLTLTINPKLTDMKKVFTLLFLATTMMASAQTVDVTFNVNMANETTSPDGVFLAGGLDFGIPGDNPMADPDGDDIWTITMTVPSPYTGNYTFLNGNCPAWDCKENIAGLSCADGPFDDRLLDNIDVDLIVNTCFSQCTTDGTCAMVGAPVDLTIHVNMANETTSPDGVYLAGGADFGAPPAFPMSDPDGDDIWSITVTLPDGYTGNYTFTNGNCPDYSCKENIVGLPCADGPFSDRLISNLQAGTVISTCFSQCSTDGTCETVADPVDVTFKVDMNNEPSLGPVYITGGTIDNWCGSCTPMDDSDGDGIYEVTLNLPQGAHEYKYTNAGWDPPGGGEEFDPATADSLCTLTAGAFTNRFLFIDTPDPIILDANCFNDCGACTGTPILPVPVVFQVDMSDYVGSVGPVYLTGQTIDSWCGTCIAMSDQDGDMIYQDTLMLDPGTHEYKFVNVGWGTDEILDPVEDEDCTLTTGGFTNRVVVVDTVMTVIDIVCYASCESCPVGIEDISFAQFSMTPTLTSDETTIRFGEVLPQNRTLNIYSIAGILIESKSVKANESMIELSFGQYSNGLYLINIETGGVNITKKLVVSK